jgi:hypothetical protein
MNCELMLTYDTPAYIRDASQKSITGDMANITSNMFSFIFLTEQLIINGKKQK